jgi:hypothetical protein
MRSWIIPLVASLFVLPICRSQDQAPAESGEKAVQWVNIQVPTYPNVTLQARIAGTVTIQVHFKNCELDPGSVQVMSGPPLLRPAALDAIQHSNILCGDFSDSNATIYYEFHLFEPPRERAGPPRVEILRNRVKILASAIPAQY